MNEKCSFNLSEERYQSLESIQKSRYKEFSTFIKRLIFVGCLSLLSSHLLFAQSHKIRFKSGSQIVQSNLNNESELSESFFESPVEGYYYRYILYNSIPNEEEKELLASIGIQLLEYYPDFVYLARVKESVNVRDLRKLDALSIFRMELRNKIDPSLKEVPYPEWALVDGKVRIVIKFYPMVSEESVLDVIKFYNLQTTYEVVKNQLLFVAVSPSVVEAIASHPAVSFVELGSPPDLPEDTGGRTLQRANLLNSPLPGGLHYDASGVKVMVRDDGAIGPHIDFEGRVVDYAGAAGGTHGDGVAGVFAGAGNIDATVAAAASGSDIYVLNYVSTFLDNTEALHLSDNVVITNSSYSNGCNAGYTTTTNTVDQQMVDNPSFLHVFSAGNSNNSNCGYGAGNQWGNITGGHKMGKNVMATANLFADETLVSSSSWGPAHDGRIKPDISAHGQGEISTDPNNLYSAFGGTSSAAPTMASSLAQLYHVYKDLNGGSDPDAALIKAVTLNTAHDLGNKGPDFKYGWGRIDAARAYYTLSDNTYLSSSVAHGDSNVHTIQIPAGIAEAKIMVYWKDPAASANAAIALVNNLDLTVEDPSSMVNMPYVLDHTPDPVLLDLPAITGVDDLNNMEQVSLLSPTAGTYSVKIKGKVVPVGPQDYYLVWTFFEDEIKVTYPNGGEDIATGEVARIHWDAYVQTGTFDVDYSLNGGSTWNSIAQGLSADTRLTNWTVPNSYSENALIRVSRGAQSDISDSEFIVVQQPTFTLSNLCTGGVRLNWNSVPGASSYNVYQLGNKYMDSIANTTLTEFNVFGLTNGTTYWFSVAPVSSTGLVGRRALALTIIPSGSGSCPVRDLSVSEILLPSNIDRSCTAMGFGQMDTISIEVSNTGIFDLSDVDLFYQIDNGSVIQENYHDTIHQGQSIVYDFATTADLSGSTMHDIQIWISHPLDELTNNDSAFKSVVAIQNLPVSLPFTEDFETATVATYTQNSTGLTGIERIDFETNPQNQGRLRTNAGAGFAKSGTRAMTMDATSGVPVNYLIFNANLENYLMEPAIFLDFSFMHHGDEINPNDRVWIRGSTSDPWVEIYDWHSTSPQAGVYHDVVDLDIIATLSAAGQSVSCTFQIRFGQEDNFSATGLSSTDGLTIDDIVLKTTCSTCPFDDDLSLTTILAPSDLPRSCQASSYSSNENVSVQITNVGLNPIVGANISYQLNGGTIVTEVITDTIDRIAPYVYTFSQTADLSAVSTHQISSWISHPADPNSSNDSLETIVTALTNPAVTLPFLEDFESAADATYTDNRLSITGLTALDFETSVAGGGRMRTNAGASFAQSGSRAITLDAISNTSGLPINYAILTVNLENYDTSDSIYLDFSFMHHGDETHTNDKVWIRGADTSTWIEIYNWGLLKPTSGSYTTVQDIDIAAALQNGGQEPSCTFQIRFGQEDDFSATSLTATDGLTIDDIMLKTTCGTCPLPYDLQVASIDLPADNVGRQCSGGQGDTVRITIENIGTTDLDSSLLFYSVNGNSPVSQLYPTTILAGNSSSFTFSTLADLTQQNQNTLEVWINNVLDLDNSNDTLSKIITREVLLPATLPILEDFESTTNTTFQTNQMGLPNLGHVDFTTSTAGLGRLRTFAGASFPQSGSRALTLDVSSSGTTVTNYIILSYNLENYLGVSELYLSFSFMQHGDEAGAQDKVWIRGGPEEPWLEIYDWGQNRPPNGVYEQVSGLDIINTLSSGGQSLGCLFQIRFGQEDNYPATSITTTDGLTIDDIGLSENGCTTPLVALCQDIAVSLDAQGQTTVTAQEINNGSTGCGMLTYLVDGQSSVTFDCNDIGSEIVTLEVIDENSDTSSCSSNITITDASPPQLSCFNTNIFLQSSSYTLQQGDVYGGGLDNCGTVSFVSMSPTIVDCSDLGQTVQVNVIAEDEEGNQASCTANIMVFDTIAPQLICEDATISLGINGTGEITLSDITTVASDNCDMNIDISRTSFSCNDAGTMIDVTVTVDDAGGNIVSCISTVSIIDDSPPDPICNDITISLSNNGSYQLTQGDGFAGGFDNCGSISIVDFQPQLMTCSDIGSPVPVLVTIEDLHGNQDTCTALITVIDDSPPQIMCEDKSVYLDETGIYTLGLSDVTSLSEDNCGTINVVSITPMTMTCDDIIFNTLVDVVLDDGNGNQSACTASITAIDTFYPEIICIDTVVLLNENAEFTIDQSHVLALATDNCPITEFEIYPNTFTCADIGVNLVDINVHDEEGNVSSCNVNVTVVDPGDTGPMCRSGIDLHLNSNGMYIIQEVDVFEDFSVTCGYTFLRATPSVLTCEDVSASLDILVEVMDGTGNLENCVASVSVNYGDFEPNFCKDITVSLDGFGNYNILPEDIINVSPSDCEPVSLQSYNPTMLDCSETSDTVMVTVNFLDPSNRSTSCMSRIIIENRDVCSFVDCTMDNIHVDEMVDDSTQLQLYRANLQILSDAYLDAAPTYLFEAGNEIILEENFTIDRGVPLTLEIEPCNPD